MSTQKSLTKKSLMIAALLSLAPGAVVLAQSQTMPSDSTPPSSTAPGSMSSPSRDTTSSSPNAPSTDSTGPAAASSPHQQQATHMASKQAMKDCIAKQQADNSGLSTADAKKACKAQMRGNSG
jgi:cytoskeletal protein RodZ